MSYTQANPIEDSVKLAIERKVKLLQERGSASQSGQTSDQALFYYTNRTPWIKMTSAVDVIGSPERSQFSVDTASELASKYILTSQYNQGSLPAGHTLSEQLGIRPRPGIQNMQITSHNQFGSLRTATVTFQVWSKEDLDACEVLYMRPGMSVLLEWGWSLYLDGTVDNITVKEMEEGYDILGKNGTSVPNTLIGILEQLNERKKQYGHDYDAVFGFVKNFGWSLRPDGGYDCRTDIVSPGEIIESINIALPVSDNDAEFYNKYKRGILDKEIVKISTQIDSLDQSNIEKFTSRWLSFLFAAGRPAGLQFGGDGFFDVTTMEREVSLLNEEKREQLLKEFQNKIETIPSYESRTALSTFFEIDIFTEAVSVLESNLPQKTNTTEDRIVLADFDLTELRDGNQYTKRLFETQDEDILQYKKLRLINWLSQSLQKTSEGEIRIEEGEEVVEQKQNPQYYLKYGLILEIMNRFMLHNNGNPIVSFDISRSSTFNTNASSFASLNPASCLLPTDMAFMEDSFAVHDYIKDAGTFFEKQTKDEVGNSVTDIYLNVSMVSNLINSTGLQTFTKDGIPQTLLFKFVEKINQSINQACAGIMELSIQYFEDDGKFAIIDRVNFNKVNKDESELFLSAIGTRSILRNIALSSALTPEMASSLAISVQTDYKSKNNAEAGFLRFNKGLQDRILTNRNPHGSFSKSTPEDTFTLSNDDLSQVETLYDIVYSQGRWMPQSFEYAREIHHKYVTEVLNRYSGDIPTNGQVVVPFSTTLTLDGTSGVKILNSLLLASNLLPYTYSNIQGGVGVLITGLEATVDASGWQTVLKSQYYPRQSANIVDIKKEIVKKREERATGVDHVIIRYANEASEQDFTMYTKSTGLISDRRGIGNLDLFANLTSGVQLHHKAYWEGNKQPTDAITIAKADKNLYDPIEAYWKNYNKNYDYDKGTTWRKAWSAVYVSFILNSFIKAPIGAKFKATYAHHLYVNRGLQALKGQQSGQWVTFSMIHQGNLIEAQLGDILVWPRESSNKNSEGEYTGGHGLVVYKIEDGIAFLADGNTSPGSTSKISRTKVLVPATVTQSGKVVKKYVYGKSEQGLEKYAVVLKYMEQNLQQN